MVTMFKDEGSNMCIFHSGPYGSESACYNCPLPYVDTNFRAKNNEEMIVHLNEHIRIGEKVPQHILDALKSDNQVGLNNSPRDEPVHAVDLSFSTERS